ncbi:hypothetical protein NM688_g2503 [Phlebia brevispora]|uniref:Uncharacterized protein n=1 Tax=Phlebia brevispora TaxID=194682 RepID=A0ACC1T8A7_9APHY|nr:hypothetical protein NM688_g2503 [Phlebia brevispora]
MAIQRLPRELVDKIVRNITDKKDIISFSVTSSHLLPSARRSLFWHVDIGAGANFPTLPDFVKFIVATPHIAEFIRDLAFRRRNHHRKIARPYVVLTIGQLSDLLSKLPYLQGLHLYDVVVRQDPADLNVEINPRYMLKQLTVTDATLEVDVIPMFHLFSHIDELTVSQYWFNSMLREWQLADNNLDVLLARFNLQVPHDLTVLKLHLETHVTNASFYTELLRRTQTPDVLTAFTLDTDDFTSQFTSSSSILDLLQACRSTLTHLTLGASDIREYPEEKEVIRNDYMSDTMRDKLSTLHELRSLTFRLVYRHRATTLRSHTLSQLTSLLSSFPLTVSKVEFIFCDAAQRFLGRATRGPWYSPDLDFHALESILLQFKSLDCVVFGGPGGISPTEREILLKELPELASKGLITFENAAEYRLAITMPIDTLPHEIITKILRKLARKQDLSSVAQVSSYFLVSARPLLFSDLRLSVHPHGATDRYDAFITLLSSSPAICDLIHNLTVERQNYERQWMSISLYISFEALGTILSRMQKLKSLCLRGVRLYWNDRPSDILHAQHTLSRLSLIESTQESDTAPLLEMFRSIGELTIINEFHTGRMFEWQEQNQSLEAFDDIFGTSIAPHVEVSSLRIDSNTTNTAFFTQLLLRTRVTHTLTSFDFLCDLLPMELPSSSLIFDFLKEVGPRLQRLTLSTGDRGRMYHTYIKLTPADVQADYASDVMRAKLSALTGLQSVAIRLVHRERSGPDYDEEAPWFCSLMTLLASFPTSVRRVELSFCNMQFATTRYLAYQAGLGPFWTSKQIDLHALQPMLQRYTDLEAVVFHSSNGMESAEKRRITSELPELARSGLIQFAEGRIGAAATNGASAPFVGGGPII